MPRRGASWPTVLATAMAAMALAPPAGAQPAAEAPADERPGANGAIAVPVEEALADIRDGYRGIVAEEVTVRLSDATEGGRRGESVDRFVVRLERPGGQGEAIKRLKLEFDAVHVVLEAGWLLAEAASGGSKIYEKAYEGEISPDLLALLLPPVPAICVAIASDRDGTLRAPTPFTRGVGWASAEAFDEAGGGRIVLRGTVAGGGDCALEASARSGRVRRFESIVRQATGDMRLSIDCRAIDPGEPVSWAIASATRTRVGSLAELRSAANGAASRTGDRTQDLMLSCMGGTGWSMHGTLRRAQAAGSKAPVAMVLLFRASVDEAVFLESERRARAGLEAIRGLVASSPDIAARAITRSAVVITPADWTPEWPGYLYERWGSGIVSGGVGLDADQLCWSISPGSSIDRYAPGSSAAIVVVDHQLVLRGVVSLEGDAMDAKAIEAALRAAIPPEVAP